MGRPRGLQEWIWATQGVTRKFRRSINNGRTR
jgi:hypothetical protein